MGHFIWYFTTEGPNLNAPIGNVLSLVPTLFPNLCPVAPPRRMYALPLAPPIVGLPWRHHKSISIDIVMHCSSIDWSILTAIYYQFDNSVLNRRTRTTELCNDKGTLFWVAQFEEAFDVHCCTYVFIGVYWKCSLLTVIMAPTSPETSILKVQFYHVFYGPGKQPV